MAATKHLLLFICCYFVTSWVSAAILPEERADVLYHSYDGGGVSINGPSVLVRKNVGDKFSFSGNYYVDMVTSASIDVLATASEYTEERTEYSLGMDYLNDRNILSLSFTNSTESDYIADTLGFTISQEFFGDLSTLTLGYVQGSDTVKATGNEDFEEQSDRRRYSLGLSQILTKKFLASFSYETVIDEGFLRNPYRQIREVEPLVNPGDRGYRNIPESYPNTRNSEAFALRGIYSLSAQSSIRAEYKKFSDSWKVEADSFELRYAFQLGNNWLFELRAKQYQQTGAYFYEDLFDFNANGTPTYYARDKELSDFSSQQFGIGITYTIKSRYKFFNDSTVNLNWDNMNFDYEDFRDVTADGYSAGQEPLYNFDATVIRLFFSAYF